MRLYHILILVGLFALLDVGRGQNEGAVHYVRCYPAKLTDLNAHTNLVHRDAPPTIQETPTALL